MKKIFEHIIHNHLWMDVLCGSGSTLAQTKLLRDKLPDILAKYDIKSMLDAPCGDYSWMSLTQFPTDFRYIGADIVESMILTNRSSYPGKDFRVIDISQDTLPDVDLIFVRDCLIHLSSSDIWKVLQNIYSSNIKYVMLTSYKQIGPNKEINTGEFRELNMTCEPFNLAAPIAVLEDGPEEKTIRVMALWSKEQIGDAIETNLS